MSNMFKKSRIIAWLLVVAIMITGMQMPAYAFDNVINADGPEVKVPANDKAIEIELKGTAITRPADELVNRINQIREEACKQGVKNPETGKPLTASDYKPIQWSSDLEAIARIRAAEASVYMGHTRPNGTNNTTATTNTNITAAYEIIAWNKEANDATTKRGIEQWYEEKNAWVNSTGGTVDHYKILISPSLTYIGIGSFKSYLGGYTATTAQFAKNNISTSTAKNNAAGEVKQKIQVANNYVTGISLADGEKAAVAVGKTTKVALAATAKFETKAGTNTVKGKLLSKATFTSADEKVATVDKEGNIKGIENGYVDITAKVAGKSFKFKMTVGDPQKAPVDITHATIKIKDQQYAGSPIVPKKDDIQGNVGYRILVKDVDYTVECRDNVEVGTASITLKAIGKNSGSITTTFKIVPRKIKNVTIDSNTFRKSIEYTGNPIEQNLNLYVDNKGVKYFLQPEKDYKVLYSNNTLVGKAKVTIIGRGNFTGEVTKKFNIVPMNIDNGKVTVSMNSVYAYQKGGCKPELTVSFNGTTLVKGKDYKVTYKNTNSYRGTAVIKGKKNFGGKIYQYYDIENQKLSNVDTYVPDVVFKDKTANYKSKPVLTDTNGKKLKAGKDYSKVYEYQYSDVSGNSLGYVGVDDRVAAGTYIKVTVSNVAGSHYDGETSYVYRVVNRSISKAKVSLRRYVGDDKITADQIRVVLSGAELEAGTDYEILSAKMNNKKTKVTVLVHGLGEYGGVKKYTYKIN